MTIRIMPPISSGLNLRFIMSPKRMPKRLPAIPAMKETVPISDNGTNRLVKLLYPMQAKEIPIAKASMLVAMAKDNCVPVCSGLKVCCFSG